MRSTPSRESSAEPAAESDCLASRGIVSAGALTTEEKGGSRTHTLHTVAALHGPGAAAAGAGVVGCREDGEGEGGEDCEAGEHGEVGMRGCVGGGWKGEC